VFTLQVPSMVVGYILLYILKAHMLAFSCSHTSIVGNSAKPSNFDHYRHEILHLGKLGFMKLLVLLGVRYLLVKFQM